jgi:hypothetical protein
MWRLPQGGAETASGGMAASPSIDRSLEATNTGMAQAPPAGLRCFAGPRPGDQCHNFQGIRRLARTSAARCSLRAAKEIAMDEMKSRPRPRKTATKTAAKKVPSAKAAAAQRSPEAAPSVPADRESLVRMAAYLRAERRGFAPGYEIEDWLAAEAEVDARKSARPAARKPRAGSGSTG